MTDTIINQTYTLSQQLQNPLTLIVAMGLDNTIGLENKMPWHLPEDLRHFKARTLGKTMIMGRHTYESIGKPLQGRRSIVISRNLTAPPHPDVLLANSLTDAIQQAQKFCTESTEEIIIAGGGQIYALALPMAQRLVITKIEKAFAGDTFFPTWPQKSWTLISKESHSQARAPYLNYSFLEYQRQDLN